MGRGSNPRPHVPGKSSAHCSVFTVSRGQEGLHAQRRSCSPGSPAGSRAGRSCYGLLVALRSSAPLGWVGVSNERAKLWSGGRKGVLIFLFLFLTT